MLQQQPVDMTRYTLRNGGFAGRFGVAREAITPPEGIYGRLWGSARHDIPRGVHRPLLATCLCLCDERDAQLLVLLTLDLSWWRSVADEYGIRTAILRACELEAKQLLLHVSHTHAAPSTSPEFADRPGGHLIEGYRQQITETCIRLVGAARTDMTAATLSWATGSCRLAYDRNLVSPVDGSIVVGLNPAKKADDTLLVGRITDARGQVRATLVNYACHPTSLGGSNELISPDYVGAMRETVERATQGAPCLFLHGASGDLTPRRSFGADVLIADQNGREVGYAALAVVAGMLPPQTSIAYERIEESGTKLAVWREEPFPASTRITARRVRVLLDLAPLPSREELQRALAAATEEFVRERLRRKLALRETAGDGPVGEFVFTVWQLGDSFLVALPAEAHSLFQQELRRQFPEQRIAVLNIVNGYLSYIPPRLDYELDTYQSRVAIYAAGAAEKVLDAATRTIAELLGKDA
jgi:hypothetical protein